MVLINASCTDNDLYGFRLRRICEIPGRNALHQVFLWGTADKDESMNMFDYLEKKNKALGPFKKLLMRDQIVHIKNDPAGGNFDISLLFVCIQFGNDFIADRTDSKWQEGGKSMESAITTLKNKRNKLTHEVCSCDSWDFFTEVEEFRKLLEHIVYSAGTRYGVHPDIIKWHITDMNKGINIIRDDPLVPLNFADYKRQSLFKEKRDFVKKRGAQSLGDLYKEWSYVTPVSTMGNVHFQADTIFTEMMLISSCSQHRKSLSYVNILDECNGDSNEPVIIIEGCAGSGKTTLTKKLLCDWISLQGGFTKIKGYDLVLHAECRNSKIQSFKELLQSLIPDLCKSFVSNDLVRVVLDLKTLIIFDGLDELNSASFSLFKELIELKKINRISLFITTRPERIQTYYNHASHRQIRTKHIRLIGISKGRRNEFVIKYYNEMVKKDYPNYDLEGLLLYLQSNENSLDALFRLPYNLTLLIILWVKAPQQVNKITTPPELYWHIHILIIERLLERLQRNVLTQHLQESHLKRKIDIFVSCLSREALTGLKNDDIDLSNESCQRLRHLCVREGLPDDEVMSAFLSKIRRKTATGWDTKESFPHKGVQDYLGAYHLWLNLVSKSINLNVERIVEEIERVLSINKVPVNENLDIVNFASVVLRRSPVEESTITTDFLASMHKPLPLNLCKYQNVLCILIGLLYLEGGKVKECAKIEVLKLLEKSGISGQNAWLEILNSVKCENSVLAYISKIPGLMKGTIKIGNDTVFGYASLLNVAKPKEVYLHLSGNPGKIPRLHELFDTITQHRAKIVDLYVNDDNVKEYAIGLNEADITSVSIDVIQDPSAVPYFKELLRNLTSCRSEVKVLSLHHYFRHLAPDMALAAILEKLSERCQECYIGYVNPGIRLSQSLRILQASITNTSSCCHFYQCLRFLPNLERLGVCLPKDIPPSLLHRLPCLKQAASVFIPDLSLSSDVNSSLRVLRRMQPESGPWHFSNIIFPRARLSLTQQVALLRGLENIKVEHNIYFPSHCRPPPSQRLQVKEFSLNKLQGDKVLWVDEEDLWSPF